MMMPDVEERHALAELNPYHSVEQCFEVHHNELLVGIKNVEQIPASLLKRLQSKDRYALHTLDAHALGGRAVDLQLINPISGRWMSGSSSGTAINVLTYINDVGIGTDGGGSVLAPAMSVNLFGFISPLIEAESMKRYMKQSTDGISFTPSIGFMTRDYETMIKVVKDAYPLPEAETQSDILISDRDSQNYPFAVRSCSFPDLGGSRLDLIDFLNSVLPTCDCLISYEGPIDLEGYGDTLFGHFDKRSQAIQKAASKGLIRVVNMVNATALCVPSSALGCGFVLICESKETKIAGMLALAGQLAGEPDVMVHRYFQNLSMYFSKGYLSEEER
ncbi:hypothetical protein DWZ33_09475 [Dielma fastidiosa]|nr:hypothetical protein DWZ33_09475 [Dielma fastidiosa]